MSLKKQFYLKLPNKSSLYPESEQSFKTETYA